MTTKNASSWLLILTLLCGGCGALKKVDDMKKTTEEMNESTKQMKKDMAEMKRQTADMLEYTQTLYSVALQGGAEGSRSKNIEAMESAKVLEHKNDHAGHYYAAVELQFWKMVSKHGDQEELDAHLLVAVEEFINRIRGYMTLLKLHDATTVDLKPMMGEILSLVHEPTFNGDFKPNYWKDIRENLYAMSLAMHKTNPLHVRIKAKHPDFKPFSMKGILEQGLEAAVKVRKGELQEADLPEWKKVLVREEAVVTYIFQLRHNLLPGVALTRLPGFRGLNAVDRWWHTGKACRDTKCWDPRIEAIKNDVDLNYITYLLEQTVKLRAYLKGLDIEPMIDENCSEILLNMQNPALNQSRPKALANSHLSAKSKITFFERVREVVGADPLP